ncbi:MAG: type I-E CRISPR-associated protein Cse2/CasB [Gammaproteobacteria bacterium]|nr:type I-E CRISPR-associated protein Cse2/CasB [Gammaproteobacteria bacterium]
MSIKFGAESTAGKVLAGFWDELRKDNGARAELRRCKTATDVMMTPVFHRLCVRLKPVLSSVSGWEERIAIITGLISHLNRESAQVLKAGVARSESDIESFIRPMADLKGDRPLVSELRFRRLLQRDVGDLYPALIRILRMVDGKTNLYGLAESVFYWGDNVKKRWAFAYFPRVPEKKTA